MSQDDAANPLAGLALADITRAAAAIEGVVLRTPLVPVAGGASLEYIKPESLQPTGAFKLRGAYNALASLTPDQRAHGVIAASSGNHGQAVAWSATRLGIRSLVVMPVDAPPIKRERTMGFGAEIVDWTIGGPSLEETALGIARERGLIFVHPFTNPLVVAGQGTVGLEIAQDMPDVGAVLVPIGGGGLASGVATALRALRPAVRLIGVEPEIAGELAASFRAGTFSRWDPDAMYRTIADGQRTNASPFTFEIIRRLFDDVVTVSDDELVAAMGVAAREARLVLEPSGASTVAAMRFRRTEAGLDRVSGPIVAVASGGNVDPVRYAQWLAATAG